MKKIINILILTFWFNFSFSQVFINELDADTPGSDVLEFIELKSTVPNFSLNGYVLVFFNGLTAGTGNLSYYSLDLDGYTTDINGIIHFGNSQVSPAPVAILPYATIQNGPDAVALYQANASDFPLDTPATATNLVSALAYSNNATTGPTALMSIFGLTTFINENQTQSATTKSIQRNNDGSYAVATPTPGVNNDGSGIVLNTITISPSVSTIMEGESFTINFATSVPVSENNLILNFTLSNGNFGVNDFSGNLTTTINVGQSTSTVTISLYDDTENEGDEELKLNISNIPDGYVLSNNNLIIRVNDNDYIVEPWGTPLNPTFGVVPNNAPIGYYNSLEGLSGNALKLALQDIIANPNVVRAHSYGDVAEILLVSDVNPANSSQIWQMYVEQPRSKIDYQTGSSNIGVWNREHIYPQSRGGFQDGTSSFADGINVWLPSNANDILSGHADAHHIRAEDGAENSLRSNRDYGSDYNGPSGNAGSWKGDVARALFYMAVRYNGLGLVNGNPPDTSTEMGDLATLLLWHQQDPPDDFEMNRNNYIYTWQLNRNPFIDRPDLANYIFGSNFGQNYTLSDSNFEKNNIAIYPNPATDYLTISGILEESFVEIYSITGNKINEFNLSNTITIPINFESGIYLVKISNPTETIIKKIVIN